MICESLIIIKIVSSQKVLKKGILTLMMKDIIDINVRSKLLKSYYKSFSTYSEHSKYAGWTRYHSHFISKPKQPLGISSILLLIPEKVNIIQTQKHCILT